MQRVQHLMSAALAAYNKAPGSFGSHTFPAWDQRKVKQPILEKLAASVDSCSTMGAKIITMCVHPINTWTCRADPCPACEGAATWTVSVAKVSLQCTELVRAPERKRLVHASTKPFYLQQAAKHFLEEYWPSYLRSASRHITMVGIIREGPLLVVLASIIASSLLYSWSIPDKHWHGGS